MPTRKPPCLWKQIILMGRTKGSADKNVAKLFPAAAVIDRSGMDIDGFLERVAGYLYRKITLRFSAD